MWEGFRVISVFYLVKLYPDAIPPTEQELRQMAVAYRQMRTGPRFQLQQRANKEGRNFLVQLWYETKGWFR